MRGPCREIAAAGAERAKARERLRTGAAVRRCAAGGFPAARRNTQAPDGAPGPSLYAREKKQCLGRAKARVRGRWCLANDGELIDRHESQPVIAGLDPAI